MAERSPRFIKIRLKSRLITKGQTAKPGLKGMDLCLGPQRPFNL
jgi:hypothetical protein